MNTIKGKKATWIGAASLLILALAACGGGGGGGGGSGSSNAPTLTSAAASVEGLLAYMKIAVASTSETSEPIDISTFVAPTSDTTEPDSSI